MLERSRQVVELRLPLLQTHVGLVSGVIMSHFLLCIVNKTLTFCITSALVLKPPFYPVVLVKRALVTH